MLKDLSPDQIDKLALGFITTANLSVGTLLFGQVTSDKPFNFLVALLGFTLWLWLYFVAIMIMRIGNRRRKKEEK